MGYYDVDRLNTPEAAAPPQRTALPGFSSAADYMVSGIPWATSSIVTTTPLGISFQNVSKFVTLINNSGAGTFLRIAFTQNGTTGSYILLNGGSSLTMEVRIADLFIRGDTANVSCSVIAGLTAIPRSNMPVLTGSGGPNGTWQGVG